MCGKENQEFIREIYRKYPAVKIILGHVGRYVHPDQFFKFPDSGQTEISSLFLNISITAESEIFYKPLSGRKLKKTSFCLRFSLGAYHGAREGLEFHHRGKLCLVRSGCPEKVFAGKESACIQCTSCHKSAEILD